MGGLTAAPPLLHLNNTCYLSHKFQRKAGLNAHDVAFWQVATCISAFTSKLIVSCFENNGTTGLEVFTLKYKLRQYDVHEDDDRWVCCYLLIMFHEK